MEHSAVDATGQAANKIILNAVLATECLSWAWLLLHGVVGQARPHGPGSVSTDWPLPP